tara:strand:- start:2410 stop:2757 length:348 start_codon:yes stop_codon:yes gene_type:complete
MEEIHPALTIHEATTMGRACAGAVALYEQELKHLGHALEGLMELKEARASHMMVNPVKFEQIWANHLYDGESMQNMIDDVIQQMELTEARIDNMRKHTDQYMSELSDLTGWGEAV